MSQLKLVLQEALKMPYVNNFNGVNNHEKEIFNFLIKIGNFKEVKACDFKVKGLQNNTFVFQPYGSQKHPDFIVMENNKEFHLECKTNKSQGFPVFNSGLPPENCIYIFSSGKHNQTTLFTGKSVLTKEKRILYKELDKKYREILKEFRNHPSWEDDRGWDFFPRKMYNLKGSSEKTDFFTHKNRAKCEQEALDECTV
jgi:hypothetical protein